MWLVGCRHLYTLVLLGLVGALRLSNVEEVFPELGAPQSDVEEEAAELKHLSMHKPAHAHGGCKHCKPVAAEHATLASQRTAWSTPSSQRRKQWEQVHKELVKEAALYSPGEHGQSRLVMVGDSIIESWRGTGYGRHVPRANKVPQVIAQTIASHYPIAAVLAIAGDLTQHVLWRLDNGELSAAMSEDPALLFVLLIGTNNLCKGHEPQETVDGILAVARKLLGTTNGKLLLNAVLLRDDDTKSCEQLVIKGAPPSFMPMVNRTNALLVDSLPSLMTEFPKRVGFVDCGASFRYKSPDGGVETVRSDLMPDFLHPNAEGHRALAGCIQDASDKLLAGWIRL